MISIYHSMSLSHQRYLLIGWSAGVAAFDERKQLLAFTFAHADATYVALRLGNSLFFFEVHVYK